MLHVDPHFKSFSTQNPSKNHKVKLITCKMEAKCWVVGQWPAAESLTSKSLLHQKKLQALEIEKKVIEHQLFLQSLPLGIFHELIQIDGSSL